MYGYPTPPVIMVPSDYPSIQEAIDAASNDSVIIVANGRYFEHVVVNKPLKLFGQDRADTIVDGNGTGVAVTIAADRVLLNGFTLVNGGIGLDASGFRNHITISNNIVISNEWGIQLRANDSILSGNVFGNNEYNYMDSSYRNLIYANSAVNGSFDFHFYAGNVFRHNNFINVYVHEDFALPLDNDWNENYWNGGRPGPHDQDYFPSSNPHGSVPVLWDNRVYEVGLSSSSSMSGIGFDQQTKTLAFYVASAPTGYCNVTVPQSLLNGPWQTVLTYYTQSIPPETAVTENETYTMIYLNYTKAAPPYSDSIRVQIIGTQVVPEFSQTSLLALLMILMGMLVLVLRMAKQDVGPKLREIR
jgi:parallel beta-helix repeat protein